MIAWIWRRRRIFGLIFCWRPSVWRRSYALPLASPISSLPPLSSPSFSPPSPSSILVSHSTRLPSRRPSLRLVGIRLGRWRPGRRCHRLGLRRAVAHRRRYRCRLRCRFRGGHGGLRCRCGRRLGSRSGLRCRRLLHGHLFGGCLPGGCLLLGNLLLRGLPLGAAPGRCLALCGFPLRRLPGGFALGGLFLRRLLLHCFSGHKSSPYKV